MQKKVIDVYEKVPVFENSHFLLRQIEDSDVGDLMKVYSDECALPLSNSDNCHGDKFHYDTLEKMQGAITFWKQSYDEKWFVRWSIVSKDTGRAIGTIEVFHRDSQDYFTNTGLLRLDLKSEYETEDCVAEIISLLLEDIYIIFDCDMVATKAVPEANKRRKGLEKLDFNKADQCLVGEDGTRYFDYYVRKRFAG